MRMDQLKLLFEAGDLLSAEVVSAPLEPGPVPLWCCQFRRRNKAIITLNLNRKRHGTDRVRVFSSLDAAFSACRSVGFCAATVTQS